MSDLPPSVSDNGPRRDARRHLYGTSSDSLDLLSESELIDLQLRIAAKLPPNSLKSVNLEQELVTQLRLAQKLQRETLDEDPDVAPTPANQKAQVINSVASTLQMLGKLQVELFDSERLKRIEQILIDTLQTLPKDAQEAFLDRYEAEIGALD